tara:strand:+ start:532 stop:1008 length:477 start_codon:yes stop_codon:yes gene_type:complete
MNLSELMINNILAEQLNNINQKIKGTLLLEILKFKFIEKISAANYSFNNINEVVKDYKYEDDNKEIVSKLIYHKTPVVKVNNILKNDYLLICLTKSIKIDIEDKSSKNYINLKLYPNTGLTLSKNTTCNINFSIETVSLEMTYIDKKLDIENLKDNTI